MGIRLRYACQFFSHSFPFLPPVLQEVRGIKKTSSNKDQQVEGKGMRSPGIWRSFCQSVLPIFVHEFGTLVGKGGLVGGLSIGTSLLHVKKKARSLVEDRTG